MATDAGKAEARALVTQHDFLSVNSFGKVHCAITGHDLPAAVTEIQRHLDSKSFRVAKAR
ncbi:unnamed protein product [Phaeothamnion confervicola]